MRVVMLSTDPHILEPGSVRDRIASYGTIFESVVVILFKRGEARELSIAPNVRVITPGGRSILSALIRFSRCLSRTVSKETCDVLSSQDPFVLGCIALFVSKMNKVPLQVQLHTDPFSKGYWSESPRRALEAFLASFVLWRAQCVRVVSERVRKSVIKATDAPVAVLPVFVKPRVHVNSVKPKEFGDGFTVVTVSRLTKEKQLATLIDAIALLPRTHLVIVGDGPERKNLEQRRTERGVFERVKFAGWKEDIGAYLEHADCYAQCSRYEGYGMSLIEAALQGLPIVSTDVGIVNDMLMDGTHLLVARATPQSMAEALTRLEENPPLCDLLGKNAQEKASASLLSPEEYLTKYKEALSVCVL